MPFSMAMAIEKGSKSRNIPFQRLMFGAIAEQLVLWFIKRTRGRGGRYRQVTGEGARRRLLGDVALEAADS